MRTVKKQPIDWLFPETRKHLLTLLLSRPEERWHLRDIARRTGYALGSVRRELSGLVNVEIVTKREDGNRTYYQANKDCPLFPELSGLFRKTAGLVDILWESMKPLDKKIQVAFVYGSMAAGSAKSQSDVDLMVIGSCSLREVVDAVHSTQDKIGREINPTIYSNKEWRDKLTQGHHFVSSVKQADKLFIKGCEGDLERLTQ
jgi:predicted nucleotidyltransferase